MTRKDMIIIAALINTGLLLTLFMTAMHHDEGGKGNPSPMAQGPVTPIIEEPVAAIASSTPIADIPGDEVDRVLQQWNAGGDFSINQQPTSATSYIYKEEKVTAPKSPTVNDKKEYVEVVVKKGDVLERIAKNHQTTVSEIMTLNRLSTTRLNIGQVLKIPKAKFAPKLTSSEPKKNATYTMKKGDSLWTIASSHQTTVEELLRLNNLTEDKARKLKPGDQITIR